MSVFADIYKKHASLYAEGDEQTLLSEIVDGLSEDEAAQFDRELELFYDMHKNAVPDFDAAVNAFESTILERFSDYYA